jgi:hypothetical protein
MRNFAQYDLSVACGISADCLRAVNLCKSFQGMWCRHAQLFSFVHHVVWCHTVSYTARKLCVKEMQNLYVGSAAAVGRAISLQYCAQPYQSRMLQCTH